MGDVQLVTRGAVAAVDFLLPSWFWWTRRGEWMRQGEEDDVLRVSAVAGSVACLSLWRCICHRVNEKSWNEILI